MRRTMLCILLSSGLCLCLNHYRLIEEPKTWNEAQQYCRKKYTDLATVKNMKDMERLIAAAGSDYEGKVWIGLYDKPGSWGWSLSARNFYRKGEHNFRSWAKSHPNKNRRRGVLCVSFKNGVWFDDTCNRNLSFVCYNKTGNRWAPTGKERYFFINQELAWHKAQAYCRKHHTDLVSVRNKTENTRIDEAVSHDKQIWIGMYRPFWWWWSGHNDKKFENWADKHPLNLSESCAASVINDTHHGKWVESHCDEKLPFMCQNNKKQLFTVKLTALKSTINLNNPAVKDAILTLVEEKMKEKGITTDFKISWVKKPDRNIFHKEEEKADVVKLDLLPIQP